MENPFIKFLLLAALLLFSFTGAIAQDEPLILLSARNISRPELRLEAIALIDQGQFKAPGGTERKDAASFIKQYLPVGRKFFVTFGGGAAGTISITWTDPGCNNRITANGPLNPGSLGIARIQGEVLGLAINSDKIARAKIWRRAPTAAERAAAVRLGKTVFVSNGFTPAQLKKLQTANLTAIDVDGDNRAELVGTFRLHSPDPHNHPPRYVFLIAEGEGANYKTAFSTYRDYSYSNIFNIGEEELIDYLDLDRDGVAEIITSYSNDRASGYHIYRRVHGEHIAEWKVIYETSNAFCR